MSLIQKLGLDSTPGLQSESQNLTSNNEVEISLLTAELELANCAIELSELESDNANIALLNDNRIQLESLSDLIQNVAVSGLTTREQAFVTHQVNQINEVVGEGFVTLPALESDGDRLRDSQITAVGLQSMGESAGKARDYVVKLIESIVARVKEWWNKFISAVGRLESSAKSVIAKAESYDTSKEAKEVKSSKAMVAGGKALSSTDIVSGMVKLSDSVGDVSEKHAVMASNLASAIITAAKSDDQTGIMKLIGEKDAVNFTTGKHIGTAKDGVLFGADLIGNKCVKIANGFELDLSTVKDAAKVSYSVSMAADAPKEIKDIARLSKDEVISVANSVVKSVDSIKKFHADNKDRISSTGDLVKAFKKDNADLKKEAKEAQKTILNLSTKVASEINIGLTISWIANVVSTSNAALKVANASI